ncbi:MAG: patatin-like phospholipase family protein [Xanthomonadales bacterium]|nr:patatin-like phospholipase family protein [Xanthomonadales bacterium]
MSNTDAELARLRQQHEEEAAAPKATPASGKYALCLSGGGYRAALFHLGSLLRLHELGQLADLALISSVSGGSIVSAWLVHRHLESRRTDELFSDWCRRIDFRETVVEPFRSVVDRDRRTSLWFRTFAYNWLAPSRRVRLLERSYAEIFGDRSLGDLPDHPRIVICATNLTFGVNWEFSNERVGDYLTGYFEGGKSFPIARAVAASSSFPPVFGPVVLKQAPGSFRGGAYDGGDANALRSRIELTDGGVYDNLASEPALRRYDRVLISDAGAPFPFHASRRYLRRLLRYTEVIGNQAGALRRRLFHASRHHGVFEGAYWSLSGPPDAGADGYSRGFIQDHLARIRTDLDRFTESEFRTLINHGYFSCQNGLDEAGLLPERSPQTSWPWPDSAHESELKNRLRSSGNRILHGRWLGRDRINSSP